MTALILVADAVVTAQSDGETSGDFYWENSYSHAFAMIDAVPQNPDGTPTIRLADSIAAETVWMAPDFVMQARQLSVTVQNTSAEALRGDFSFTMQTYASAPIPEPSSALLLTVGIAGLILLSRPHVRRWPEEGPDIQRTVRA